jgi:hypothetical protein
MYQQEQAMNLRRLLLIVAVLCSPVFAAVTYGQATVSAWTGNVAAPHLDVVGDREGAKLEPIKIIAARNGTFSGKLVLCGGKEPLTNVSATVTGLKSTDGKNTISADSIQVRLATGHVKSGWHMQSLAGSTFDVLEEGTVAKVEPITISRNKYHQWFIQGRSYLPVWVTVKVPADAAPGDYAGVLTAQANGKKVQAPIELKVHAYTLPDSTEFVTWIETIQSPDSLAMQYDVKMWSPQHWKLIEKSLEYGAMLGNRSVYFPLIAETNFGNAESSVRWTPKGNNRYEYDTSIVEKYLDLQIKIQGKPKLVVFPLWDVYLEGGAYAASHESDEIREARQDHKGNGPEVTTPEGDKHTLPLQSAPASQGIWAPLFVKLQGLLAKRGLGDALTFGMATDIVPHEAVVNLVEKNVPGARWAIQSHSFYGGKDKKANFRYAAFVWGVKGYCRGEKGWLNEFLLVQFPRNWANQYPITSYRQLGEVNITGGQHGAGRLGLDYFNVVKDQRGRLVGQSWSRYPKANWRNLNITECLLAPGPEGPIATARFEMLREGTQECETRIYIQTAIDSGRLPAALAAECKKVLSERDQWLKASAIRKGDRPWFEQSNPDEDQYKLYSGQWQEKSDELFACAAKVTATGLKITPVSKAK